MTTSDDFDDDYDDYDGFDDEEGERGVSGFVVLLIILAMLLAFFFTVMVAYKNGIRKGEAGDAPYVAADPAPAKTVIAGNGGDQPQTREVYDRLEGNAAARTEVLGSGPEEPILSSGEGSTIAALASDAQDAITSQASDSLDDVTAAVGNGVNNTANNASASVNAAADNARNTLNQVAQQGRNAASDAANNATGYGAEQSEKLTNVIADAVSDTADNAQSAGQNVTNSGANRPINAAISSVPNPPTRLTTQNSQSTSSGSRGSHVVQVGAFRSETEADSFWTRLENRFGGFLDGKTPDIERADLGDRGVFYRLRIGSFNDADSAKSYCSSLKARDQDCLVKKR